MIAQSRGSQAIRVSGGSLESQCNVFWDNPDGIGDGYTPGPTDIIADPLFCDPAAGDFTVAADSPCLPANSGPCGLIGALGQGCGAVAVEGVSWGSIKAMYR